MNYLILAVAFMSIIAVGVGFIAIVFWAEHQLNKEGVDYV